MFILFWFSLVGFPAPGTGKMITLDGLPLQVEWFDVDGNGLEDMVALMLLTQTDGQIETFFDDGKLRGIYKDQTIKEKYLTTWLQAEGQFKEANRIPLGRKTILGFALEQNKPARLMLWQGESLVFHQWTENQWRAGRALGTPGLLAGEAGHLGQFPFWQVTNRGSYWLVPDLDGLHVIFPADTEKNSFLPYPDFALENNNNGGHRDNSARHRHRIELAMPTLVDLDGDGVGEITFQGERQGIGWRLGEKEPAFRGEAIGQLMDMNGDGLADLVRAEEEGDVEKLRDLPKVTSRIKIYLAGEPFIFSSQPDREQVVPGYLLDAGDTEIAMPNPFEDINSDGRPDAVGFAFKLSFFQIARVATTGRMTMKFLMSLSRQMEDGRFEPLAGGPFEMTWKINLRRLRMPSFAQMTADFDGDGWIDILLEKKSKLHITPVNQAGFQRQKKWVFKIPSALRDPAQVFGRDVNGDGKAEFILMKVKGHATLLAALEHAK